MSDIQQILSDWNSVTSNLETAINNRENRQFVLLYRDGCKCFNMLKEFLDNSDKESLLRFQDDIQSTINHWQHITELLKPWMSEIQTTLNQTKEKQLKQKKVGKLFNTGSNKAGINLKVKAK